MKTHLRITIPAAILFTVLGTVDARAQDRPPGPLPEPLDEAAGSPAKPPALADPQAAPQPIVPRANPPVEALKVPPLVVPAPVSRSPLLPAPLIGAEGPLRAGPQPAPMLPGPAKVEWPRVTKPVSPMPGMRVVEKPRTGRMPMMMATSEAGPAMPNGQDIIRETKLRVLQRHYETALNEAMEMEKAALTAPPEQRETIAAKRDALKGFAEKLEADLRKLGGGAVASPVSKPMPAPATRTPGVGGDAGTSYSPVQATGAPSGDNSGLDNREAWCPHSPDSDLEWLEVTYEKAVEIAEVRIHETYATGALALVIALVPDGAGKHMKVLLWEGRESVEKVPCVNVIKAPSGVRSNAIRIELETKRTKNWQEIDAVELVGRDGSRQWAKSAKASSYWGSGTPTIWEGVDVFGPEGRKRIRTIRGSDLAKPELAPPPLRDGGGGGSDPEAGPALEGPGDAPAPALDDTLRDPKPAR